MKKTFQFPLTLELAAIFITGFLSASFLIIKPLMIGALIDDYHLTPTATGVIAGIELISISLAAMITPLISEKWGREVTMKIGAIFGILGSLAPAFTSSALQISIARLIAGLGCGLIASNILAIIGSFKNPDRTLGMYYLFSFACGAILMQMGAWTISHFRISGAYILLAILLSFVFVFIKKIPVSTHAPREENLKRESHSSFPKNGLIYLGISFFFWIGMGTIWSFIERLGLQATASKGEISIILSCSQIFSIFGALITSISYVKPNRSALLSLSIILTAISMLLIGWANRPILFGLGTCIFSLVWPLFLTYLGGLMANIDSSGRIIAMSVATQTFGMAIGSGLGGLFAEIFGYTSVPTIGLICTLLCFILLIAQIIPSKNKYKLPPP